MHFGKTPLNAVWRVHWWGRKAEKRLNGLWVISPGPPHNEHHRPRDDRRCGRQGQRPRSPGLSTCGQPHRCPRFGGNRSPSIENSVSTPESSLSALPPFLRKWQGLCYLCVYFSRSWEVTDPGKMTQSIRKPARFCFSYKPWSWQTQLPFLFTS